MRPVLILLFACACFAQTGPEATLSGTISDAATHQPIEGARVSVRGGRGPAASATSNTEGAYSIRLPASERVGLTIEQAGYSTLDLRSSDRTSVRLSPGQSETRDFELSKPGSLSGRLVDRDSAKPLAGFYIHAIRWYAGAENSVGFRYPAAPTSADGSFTIPNLPPAQYVLVADPPMAGRIAAPKKVEAADEAGYGASWYPGVPRPEMAAPIVVGYGENRRVEMQLRKHEMLHIAGVLRAPEGVGTGEIWIGLNTEDKGRPTGAEGGIPAAGPFRVDGLEDGSYRILASTISKDGTHLFASLPVELTGHSVDDLDMPMLPGVALRVGIKMAEDDKAPPPRIEFLPLSIDGWGPLEQNGPGPADPMVRTGLPPGRYRVALMRRPGYAVASAAFNGTALPPGSPVDLLSSESTMTFVLTTELGGITGTVRDASGEPVGGMEVLLIPESSDADASPADAVESDASGGYAFTGLAPGRYRVIASDSVRRTPTGGTTVEVSARRTTAVDIPAVK